MCEQPDTALAIRSISPRRAAWRGLGVLKVTYMEYVEQGVR